ncbi:MAG: hypothetical protein JO130_18775 [Solirubrobacterales bacterium]|nr:hypothetical protein [Solirubrobacterales bacterium]
MSAGIWANAALQNSTRRRRETSATTSEARHATTAPARNTAGCLHRSVAVAMMTGRTLPAIAKASRRTRPKGSNELDPIQFSHRRFVEKLEQN